MIENPLTTRHAPAERLTPEQVMKQAACFADNAVLTQAFDAAGVFILIINKQRQIVFANKAFLGLLNLDSYNPLLGKRPGEAVDCINASKCEGGCGTSEYCRHCDVVNIVLRAMKSEKATKGEVILRTRGGSVEIPFNLLENVEPFCFEGNEFYIISLMDISDAKRRTEFEAVFFHDIINTSGGLSGLFTLLKDEVPEEIKPDIELAQTAFSNMIDEILFHRKLLEAEIHELDCNFVSVNSKDIFQAVVALYKNHSVMPGRAIAVENCESLDFHSDEMLLRKVLGNMLKNALEATSLGGKVTVGCQRTDTAEIEFWVHNDAVIPTEIQHRIFQRSFSTKGRGRGIGTYSIKLFAERYLNGRVSFVSNEASGTIFSLVLPNSPR